MPQHGEGVHGHGFSAGFGVIAFTIPQHVACLSAVQHSSIPAFQHSSIPAFQQSAFPPYLQNLQIPQHSQQQTAYSSFQSLYDSECTPRLFHQGWIPGPVRFSSSGCGLGSRNIGRLCSFQTTSSTTSTLQVRSPRMILSALPGCTTFIGFRIKRTSQ